MGTTPSKVAVFGRDEDGHRVNLGDVYVSNFREESRKLLGLEPRQKPKADKPKVKEDKPKKTAFGTKSKSKGKSKKR